MASINPGSVIAASGITDQSKLQHFIQSLGLRCVPWSPHISALIIGDGDDVTQRWKYTQALARGIQILRASALVLPTVRNELWVDLYRPSSLAEVIGNTQQIADIASWLKKWTVGHTQGCLVTGPPGIGKTTAVHLLVAAAGYEIVELNASNERSASAVRRWFEDAARSRTVGKRRALVMDEVDGMSSGDRGGIGELAKIIKAGTGFPVVCIANDRSSPKIRPLAACCMDIRFTRPTKTQIAKALMTRVVGPEKLVFKQTDLEVLCERNGNDIRSIVNYLQFSVGKARSAGKDELQRMDIFGAGGRLLSGKGTYDELSNLVFVDHAMVPLMVQEGYPATIGRSSGSELQKLESLVKAADAISDYDLVDHRIHRAQTWSLLPTAVGAIVAASRACAGGTPPFQIFPAWLGKQSKRAKHRRWVAGMRPCAGQRGDDLCDTLETLRVRLFKGCDGGAGEICTTLDDLQLTRDDMLETLVETALDEAAVKLDTKTKSAISREWKKRHPTIVEKVATAAADDDDDGGDYVSDDELYEI
jgi:replication factor C subunit 1